MGRTLASRQAVSVLRTNGRRRVSYAGHGHTWVQFVKKFLVDHPTCDHCGEPSSEFRYIRHHNGDESRLFDQTNMVPLCGPCHHGVADLWYGHDRSVRTGCVRSRGGGSGSLGTLRVKPSFKYAFFGRVPG